MRDHAVGRWQKAQALKVWTRCGGHDGKPMALECLQADFVAKLRNRTRLEMAEIEACRRHMPSETLSSCLGLETLGQRKLYKKMEDSAFVYRSMCGSAVKVAVFVGPRPATTGSSGCI